MNQTVQSYQHNGLEAVVSNDCPLSKRVSRVFALRSLGLSKKQVADMVHREVCTIHNQSSAVMEELGVHSLSEAVALAIAEGWLTIRYVAKKVGK